jgi:hypothetical protein
MLDINEFIFDENEDAVIMDCNSFVDLPAHMKPFVTFKNQRPYVTNKQSFGKPVQYAFNEEERTVMGALISAGTPIYRNDNGKEYYGFFKKATITKIQERMMKQGYMHNLNTMHDPKAVVKGAFLTNIFQVDAKKGIAVPDTLKGQNLLDGSLIAIYKIDDNTLWSDIKSGKFRGFSIEAYLDIKKANVKKASMGQSKLSKLKMGKLSEVSKWDINVDQDTFEVGTSLTTTWKDDDNGDIVSKLNDGEYVTEDGKRILVDSDGIVRLVFKEKVNIKKANMAAKKKSALWARLFGEDEEEKIFATATAADGTILTWEGDLAEKTPIFIEVNGEKSAPIEGPYEVTLEDGTTKVVVVDANGVISSVEDMEEMAEETEEILEVVAEVMRRKMTSQKEAFEKRIEDQKTTIATLTKRIDALEADRKPSKYQDTKKPAAKTGADSPAWKTINK